MIRKYNVWDFIRFFLKSQAFKLVGCYKRSQPWMKRQYILHVKKSGTDVAPMPIWPFDNMYVMSILRNDFLLMDVKEHDL